MYDGKLNSDGMRIRIPLIDTRALSRRIIFTIPDQPGYGYHRWSSWDRVAHLVAYTVNRRSMVSIICSLVEGRCAFADEFSIRLSLRLGIRARTASRFEISDSMLWTDQTYCGGAD